MNLTLEPTLRHATLAALCMSLSLTGAALADDETEMPGITPAAQTPLPEAKELFAAAMDAIGGREALEKIESSMVKGNVSTPMGRIGMESYFASPNKFLLKQNMPGMGDVSMGSDGTVAWMRNPMMGYELIESDDAEEMMGQASMHNIVLRMEKEFKEFEVVERTSFKNEQCYKVRMKDKEGKEQFAYFLVEGKFLAGMEVTQEGPMGPATITMEFKDWREYGDIKMFNRMIMNQMGMNMTMEFEEIEFNNVDNAIFTLPSEIKKLAEQLQAAENDSDE